MKGATAHSLAVGDNSENGHVRDTDNAARGATIKSRRESAGMTVVDLAGETGVARQTIARAEEGQASRSTYRQLEAWFDRFDEETGANAPTSEIIEFEVSGDFGVRVVVRGPITNAEDLERSVARIVRSIRQEGNPPTEV